MSALIDGQPLDFVPVDDRALLFGESVFETIAFRAGRAPLWDWHMARLDKAARIMGWEQPNAALLAEECSRLLAGESLPGAVVRITLTGGSGGAGYWPPAEQKIRRIVQVRPWPQRIERQQVEGLEVIVSSFQLPRSWIYSGLKHGNRLLQTRAAQECRVRGADEALLLDGKGQFSEALSSNLLLVMRGEILTPADVEVRGVGLSWLRAELGERVRTGSIVPGAISELDEMLVINSVAGVRPVVAVEDHRLPCGPVGRELQSIWRKKLFACD